MVYSHLHGNRAPVNFASSPVSDGAAEAGRRGVLLPTILFTVSPDGVEVMLHHFWFLHRGRRSACVLGDTSSAPRPPTTLGSLVHQTLASNQQL